jgi:hypothetical protein
MAQSDKMPTTAFKPRRLKQVTFPTFKILPEVPIYLSFLSEIRDGTAQKKVDPDTGKPMKAARIAIVRRLETNELGQIVVPAVLESVLQENYPGDSYQSKGFEIVKHAAKDGKRYNTFDVNEVAVD